MEMDMDTDIAMDKEVTNPGKKMILKQVKLLHGSDHHHPRGIFTAPFPCHVIDTPIKDGVQLLMGQPIMKATVSPSLIPIKTFSESEKSKFKKILEACSSLGMYPMPDVPVDLNAADISSSNPLATFDDEVVLRRYENFKKFDFAVDHSDHLFSAYRCVIQKTDWLNKIRQDWRILGEHLPDTIFVRAYKSRMDLLRAVIIGPHGTPYQDGLFVFDLHFTESYPNSPPLVRYHSCGLSSINPVISNRDGVKLGVFKVSGREETLWEPSMNVLKLLVFIQDLILNTKPYYNGFINVNYRKSIFGEWSSMLYNENTIVKSLKTMVYTMKKPPKNFEDFVVGHFHKRVRDILMVCKAYTEGLLVGCLVNDDYEPCSVKFKNDVALCIEPLVEAFKKIGAKEAQEFDYLINIKKSIVDEDFSDRVNKKRKDTESCEFLPWNIFAHRDCVVTNVLIKCPTWVEKGQPLYSYDLMKPKEVIMPLSTNLERSAFEMILEANHSSRVGIFSMEDVLVDLQDIAKTSKWKGLLRHEEVNKSYENFKKFEFVSDHTDHYFSAPSFAINQPPNGWVNKIHEEWRNLEESLPDTILVRVYESRMDLLRAVIIGPEGTPYHGGLFFFDVCFPSNYPHSPPLMHYHSGGLDINPNLSKCGKVRLSLPNRHGFHETIWLPGKSTMLQFLIYFQNWILNSAPLFNDPTYAIMTCNKYGQHYSFRYNENIRIKSLKTMVHTMNNPTKNFGEFIAGHFCKYASDILTMAYHQNNYSVTYGNDLSLIIQPLMDAFLKMGASKNQLAISGKE